MVLVDSATAYKKQLKEQQNGENIPTHTYHDVIRKTRFFHCFEDNAFIRLISEASDILSRVESDQNTISVH